MRLITISVLLIVQLISTPQFAIAKQIQNNVSVESSSSKDEELSTVKVKTTIDGVVVEDYEETSSEGTINYHSQFGDTVVGATSSMNSGSLTDPIERERIEEIIRVLREVIRLLTKEAF